MNFIQLTNYKINVITTINTKRKKRKETAWDHLGFPITERKEKKIHGKANKIKYFVRNSISLYLSRLPYLVAMYLSNKYMLCTGHTTEKNHSKDFFRLNKYFLPNANNSTSFKITLFAHSQTANIPAPGTNQIAGFGEPRPLSNWEKIFFLELKIWSHQTEQWREEWNVPYKTSKFESWSFSSLWELKHSWKSIQKELACVHSIKKCQLVWISELKGQNLERQLELKCSTFANSVTWYVLEISNNKSPYLDLPKFSSALVAVLLSLFNILK